MELDEKLNKLTLNQDYDVISNWDPDNVFSIFKVALPASSSANTLHRSKQEQLQWLKIRSFIPVLLLASIKNDANKLKAYLETFQQCLENLGFLSKVLCFLFVLKNVFNNLFCKRIQILVVKLVPLNFTLALF